MKEENERKAIKEENEQKTVNMTAKENKRDLEVDLCSCFSPSANILTIHLFRLLKAGLSPAGCSSSAFSG